MAISNYKYNYAGLKHMPLFLINGQPPPGNVRYGYTDDTEQLVRSQRNAKGVVVSEPVGNRIMKFNNLEWPIMSRSDYEWLQDQIAKFYCTLKYYDPRRHGVVEREFYWGDLSAEPFDFERDDASGVLIPKTYINVKINLIDCGK